MDLTLGGPLCCALAEDEGTAGVEYEGTAGVDPLATALSDGIVCMDGGGSATPKIVERQMN